MNPTAVETLERRLDATRRALIGEQDRLKSAVEAAAHAAGYVAQIEDGIRKSEQIIADLQDALDELHGWAPQEASDAPCPSCGARPGEPCRSPNGGAGRAPRDPRSPHMTCDAGGHWTCPARHTTTLPCKCMCHQLDIFSALRLEGIKGQIVSGWSVS